MRPNYYLIAGFFLFFFLSGSPIKVLAQGTPETPYTDNAISHYQKGQFYMGTEQYDFAIREFQIAIKLNPHSEMTAAVYNNMGLAYQKIGELPKAIVSFQEAIALNPIFALYYSNLSKTYAQSGRLAQALKQIRHSLNANPNDAKGWYLLGELAKANHDDATSNHAFQQYLKLAPDTQLADSARYYLHKAQPSPDSQSPSPYPYLIPAPGTGE